jgi:hypothetical protein
MVNSSFPRFLPLNPVLRLANAKMSKKRVESAPAITEPFDQGLPTRPGSQEKCIEQSQDSTIEFTSSHLPPVDRGKDAWLFLIAAFAIEALTIGEPFLSHNTSSY